VISDLDIYRAANLVISRQALMHWSRRRGWSTACLSWAIPMGRPYRRIRRAIEALQAAPGGGAAVS
jgi:hypothetical protein